MHRTSDRLRGKYLVQPYKDVPLSSTDPRLSDYYYFDYQIESSGKTKIFRADIREQQRFQAKLPRTLL